MENLHAELYGPSVAEPPLPTLYRIEDFDPEAELPAGFTVSNIQVFEVKVDS
jgi:hypothetical protein